MLEELDIKTYAFNNDIRLITSNVKDSKFISINIFVNVGNRDEEKGEAGIAHFLEHIMFSGTKKRKDNKEISFEVETIGGSFNAVTSDEYTIYYVKVPYENFMKALDIISDMFLNSTFEKDFIDLERGVVEQELNMYKDNPRRLVYENFTNLLYKGTSLSGDLDLQLKSLDSINRDKLINFISKYYLNMNTIVSVVGNISKYDVEREVYSKFSNKKSKENSYVRENAVFNVTDNKIIHIKKDLNQSNFILGMKSFSLYTEYYYELLVMSTILGGGEGSHLFQFLRNKLGVAYYASAYNYMYTDNGYFIVSAGVEKDSFLESLKSVIKFLNEFRTGNFNKEDIDRAKGFVIGGIMSQIETADSIADFILTEYAYLGKVRSIKEMKEGILSVSKNDILKVFALIYRNLYLSVVTNSKYDYEQYDNILKDANY